MACQSLELFQAYLEANDMGAQMVDEEHNLLRIGIGLKKCMN